MTDPKVISSPVENGSTPAPVALSPAAEPAGERVVTAKIQRIRELIARGEYAVDLDELAVRIVDEDVLRVGNVGDDTAAANRR